MEAIYQSYYLLYKYAPNAQYTETRLTADEICSADIWPIPCSSEIMQTLNQGHFVEKNKDFSDTDKLISFRAILSDGDKGLDSTHCTCWQSDYFGLLFHATGSENSTEYYLISCWLQLIVRQTLDINCIAHFIFPGVDAIFRMTI